MSHIFRYPNFVDEERAGKTHGVFIDDTGSPGLEDSTGQHPKRKSWVAVVVPRLVIAEVWDQFPKAITELKIQTGANEFHFADVLMGRREFEDIPLSKRLAIFGFMSHVFSVYNFPILVQTLDPISVQKVRGRAQFPSRLGPFNFKKQEDLALFFLLLRVKRYLEMNYIENDRLARVFVDEGYKKNGTAISIPPLNRVFADGLICFARSDAILPLQLADFAAFCLNRVQFLLGRPKLSQRDELLLRIIQPIVWNYQNIPKMPLGNWFSEIEKGRH